MVVYSVLDQTDGVKLFKVKNELLVYLKPMGLGIGHGLGACQPSGIREIESVVQHNDILLLYSPGTIPAYDDWVLKITVHQI